jgi:hypothetical protein
MANCVRHAGIGEEVTAKWPRRGSQFCTEACAALYGLEVVTETSANAIVTKDVGAALPHAKGFTTSRPPGDPTQPIPKSEPTPTAVAEPDAEEGIEQDDGLDGMSKADLKAECEALDLSTSGTKDDLIARIRDHHDAD